MLMIEAGLNCVKDIRFGGCMGGNMRVQGGFKTGGLRHFLVDIRYAAGYTFTFYVCVYRALEPI